MSQSTIGVITDRDICTTPHTFPRCAPPCSLCYCIRSICTSVRYEVKPLEDRSIERHKPESPSRRCVCARFSLFFAQVSKYIKVEQRIRCCILAALLLLQGKLRQFTSSSIGRWVERIIRRSVLVVGFNEAILNVSGRVPLVCISRRCIESVNITDGRIYMPSQK